MLKAITISSTLLFGYIQAQVTWTSPVTISDSIDGGEDPQIAVNASGYAVAIWDTNNDAASSSRPLGGNWSSQLYASAGSISSPQLGIDATGNIVAVWSGPGAVIGGGILPYNSVWTLAPIFTVPIVAVQNPSVAVNPSGQAAAVWVGNTGTPMIQSARLSPFGSTTWNMTADLSMPGQSADQPQVAFGASDKVVAVWLNQTTGFIESAYMTFNTGVWSTPAVLSSSLSSAPQVSINSSGDAIAVWVATDGVNNRIEAARLAYGSGTWIPYSMPLSPAGENSSEPQVAIDSLGNAVAVWTESNAGLFYVRAAYLTANGTSVSLYPFLSSSGAGGPDVAIDPNGNAVAVWVITATSPLEYVQSSDLALGASSWSAPINVSDEADIYVAHVAVDGFGNPTVVWVDLPAGSPIYRIRAASGYVPSTGFSAKLQKCNFGVVEGVFVLLSWPLVNDTIAYRIYRDNVLIATLAPNVLSYADKIIKGNSSQKYLLTRINNQGIEVQVGITSAE